MLLAKVHGEVVAPCEAFVTHMTFVPWLRVSFVYFAVMGLDRAEGASSEGAVLKITPVGWLLTVGIQVLLEVNKILAAVVTTVTFKGPVLTVTKAHVVAEGGRQRAGHVTQRALIMIHMVAHVVPQQPLRGKSLGTVRTLEVLLIQ